MMRLLFQYLFVSLIIYIFYKTLPMRKLQKIISQKTSTQKFYQIIKDNKQKILPKAPHETIISKYLKKQGQPMHLMNKFSKKVNQKKNKDYIDFLQMSPQGTLLQRIYKNVHLTMLSIDHQNIDLAEIYQICKKCEPDLVFMQARPDHYIHDFCLMPKIGNTFSDLAYLNQLILGRTDIQQKVLAAQMINKFNSIVQPKEKVLQSSKVYINNNKSIVDDQIVLMGAFYAYRSDREILFAQIPEQPWRQWICNSNTLMELQEIFKNITKNIPFYQSYNFTPYKLATIINPKFFLTLNDRYMSTLIQMVIASKKYKKILCISGLMENYAMEKILLEESVLRKKQHEGEFIPIIQYLIGPQIKPSLLRNVQGWEIIEKHIILDILIHGEDIANIGLDYFKLTNKIIDIYGRQMYNYDDETIMRFRFEKTVFYLNLLRSQMGEGRQLKRKIILREAIRQTDKN